jgi:hypothetical protein
MQQKLEQKNVSLKKVGAALLLMRDEEIDGLTNVAVSEEEPSENDQSKANLKKHAKKQQRRSDRLENALHHVHHLKVSKTPEKFSGMPATSSHLSTTEQSPRVDEALRLFEKKYKLNAPDLEGGSHDAQASAVNTDDPGSLKTQEKDRSCISEKKPSTLSVEMLRVETKHPPAQTSTAAIGFLDEPNEMDASVALPATNKASDHEDTRKDASAEVSSDNVSALLKTIGDDQRSNASTTIRRVQRRGRRYKDVITVVSKSDESQKNLSTTGRTSNEIRSNIDQKRQQSITVMSRAPTHSKASGRLDKDSTTVRRLPLQISTTSRPLLESATVDIEEKQDRSCLPDVKAKPSTSVTNNDRKKATPVEDTLSGQKSESPVFNAVIASYQATPKSTKATWLRLSRIMSPKWFTKRISENLAISAEMPGSGKVMPLIAITYPVEAPEKCGQGKSRDKQSPNNRAESVLPNATIVLKSREESGIRRQNLDNNDDDASSLFNFQSANSSEKDLGDIFSFISSRKGSHEASEPRKNNSHNPIRQESAKAVRTLRRTDKDMTILTPSNDRTNATIDDVRETSSLDIAKTAKQEVMSDTQNVPAKKKPTGLRIFTSRTRREHFLSFLSTRHRKEKTAKLTAPVVAKKKSAIGTEETPDGSVRKIPGSQEIPKKTMSARPVAAFEQVEKHDAIHRKAAVPHPTASSLPSVAEPVSPTTELSRDLTRSTSADSHATGGVFGFGNLLTGICGRSKRCSVDQPFPWQDCGQEDDEHSLMETSTIDIDDEIDRSAIESNAEPICQNPRNTVESASSLPTLDSVVDTKNQDVNMPPPASDNLQPLDGPTKSSQAENPEAVESIETVLHNNSNDHTEAKISPMRRIVSMGNLSVANGTVFNIRVSLRYLKGLHVSFNKTVQSCSVNRSLVVGFVRVNSDATFATQSIDIARSRPVNLLALGGMPGPLPPVAWSSKRVLDKRRGRLYFSVVLKQLVSGDGSFLYSPERIRFVFGLQCGEETIELGTASFDVDGTEISQKRLDLPLRSESRTEKKTALFGSLRKSSNPNSFRGDKHVFSLHPMSALSARIDVRAGDHDIAGPLVWEDYIVGDDESFDESFEPSVCEERSLEDHYDSVEVVPLSRGAAIITKNSYLDGNASYRGKTTLANEIVSSLRNEGQHGTPGVTPQRQIIPKLFSRKKPDVIPLSSKEGDRELKDTKCQVEPTQNTQEVKCQAEPINNMIVGPEEESLRSPISESHSEYSASAFPSNDEESSAGESSSSRSRERVSLTDKAADWVYRGARAAGFFSYSSDDEKMTQFSFSTKGETQMRPTSDLSESVMTDEASEVVIGQLKYWIQTETSTSHTEEIVGASMNPDSKRDHRMKQTDVARHSVTRQHHNEPHSLEHFKKMLLLAQRLNLSPHDLIRRLEQGENIEELLHSE